MDTRLNIKFCNTILDYHSTLSHKQVAKEKTVRKEWKNKKSEKASTQHKKKAPKNTEHEKLSPL
jgi:hypothetical protein